MKELKGRHLLLAGTAAAALHVGALALIFLAPASEGANGQGGMGGRGIEISLADLSGATGSTPPIQDAESPSATMAEPLAPELADAEMDAPELADMPPPEPVPDTAPPIADMPAPVLAETLPDLIPIETPEAEPVEPEPDKREPKPEIVEVEPEKPELEIVEADDLEEPEFEITEAEAEEPETVEADESAEEQKTEFEMIASAPLPMPRPERAKPVQERKSEPESGQTAEPERQPDPAPLLPKQPEPEPEPEPISPFASGEAPELDNWSQAALPGANAARTASRGVSGAGNATPEEGAGGGSPRAPGVPGNSAAQSDFRAEIAAWIGRHKRYPRRARAQGIEGMGVLHFAMDRSGNVLSAEIAQSSGNADLDKAILEMIRRAEPLPQIPAGLGERLEFSVPIDFALR